MVNWARVSHFVANVGFFTTMPTQLVLIILTLFFVKRNYGYYKYLIVAFSSCGVAFASLEFIVYPVLHSKNCGYIIFSFVRSGRFSKEVMNILLIMYCGFYASTMGFLALQFLYRYWAVFKIPKLRYFKSWKFYLWLLYPISLGVAWSSGGCIFTARDQLFDDYMREEMRIYYETDINDLNCMGMVVYDPVTKNIRWWNVCSAIDMTSIITAQYAIMLYCGMKMHYEMENKIVVFSQSLQRLHKQMFKTLVLQIIVPTFTLFLPIFFTNSVPFLDLEFSAPTGAMLCGLSLYPAMDAFIVIYVVSDYRKIVLSFARKLFRKVYTIPTLLGSREVKTLSTADGS